jgi:hypothetical protein
MVVEMKHMIDGGDLGNVGEEGVEISFPGVERKITLIPETKIMVEAAVWARMTLCFWDGRFFLYIKNSQKDATRGAGGRGPNEHGGWHGLKPLSCHLSSFVAYGFPAITL